MKRILLTTVSIVLSALPAVAQTDRVVALVVSVGAGAARADAMQAQLQAMGVETLRAGDPNNAELRSILKRFADEASDARASFIYADVPAVAFQGRQYVLPEGSRLGRATDLFTQGIPVQAFARSTAQAEQGGAVVMTVSAPPSRGIPSGLVPVTGAPDPVAGSSPIVVAPVADADPLVRAIAEAGRAEVVELGAMLGQMATGRGVSVSALPATPAYLRRPATAPAPLSDAVPVVTVRADVPETLEELEILEQSLSRSAKRAIQRSLRDLTFYKGLVDGIFGPQTRQAIIAYQQIRSETPTGVLSRRQLLDLKS